jgi:hypothetical protein
MAVGAPGMHKWDKDDTKFVEYYTVIMLNCVIWGTVIIEILRMYGVIK